jgi:Fe-S-cluster containining protein
MDLKKFSKKAQRNKQKLTAFLQKLDEIVPENFSAIVVEEDAKVWQKVDCTNCANCCKTMTPTFTQSDIKRIAAHLNLTKKELFDRWLQQEEDTKDIVNRNQPCQFLVDNKCSIYAVRPVDCAEFPHHYKRPFDDYNDTFIQNVHRCPATYELVSQLEKRVKKEYEW